MEDSLYDEFGNYIGPELGSEESGQVQFLAAQRTHMHRCGQPFLCCLRLVVLSLSRNLMMTVTGRLRTRPAPLQHPLGKRPHALLVPWLCEVCMLIYARAACVNAPVLAPLCSALWPRLALFPVGAAPSFPYCFSVRYFRSHLVCADWRPMRFGR